MSDSLWFGMESMRLLLPFEMESVPLESSLLSTRNTTTILTNNTITIPTHNPTYNNPTYNKHPIKILSTLRLGQILGRVVADEVLGVQLQQRADLRHERVNRGLLTLTHHTQPHL